MDARLRCCSVAGCSITAGPVATVDPDGALRLSCRHCGDTVSAPTVAAVRSAWNRRHSAAPWGGAYGRRLRETAAGRKRHERDKSRRRRQVAREQRRLARAVALWRAGMG